MSDVSLVRVARPRWRVVLSASAALAAFLAMGFALSSGLGLIDMARWAAAQQRAFHDMVTQLLSLESGNVGAIAALLGACLIYGFVHAAIPGHGKFLIAGAGLASNASAARLVAISLMASFCQAATAVALVYGSFTMLDITAGWAMIATDRVLIPLSYVAIMLIAVVLIRRAGRGLKAIWHDTFGGSDYPGAVHHVQYGECGCGHRHGPTPDEVANLHSVRDALMLIIGIGLRPCTGAVFVLVAAWRLGLLEVGVFSAAAMAAGTGAFVSLVAISAVTARGATFLTAGAERARFLAPLLQLFAGVAILFIAMAFLLAAVTPL
ncbi:MAG: hypothetical protein AAGF45_08850 [Pseudomonadota bacterium]